MSKVKLTLPGLEIPVTGKQVTFSAPCDCSSVECLQINGVDYCVVDALGRQVTGTTGGGVWATGAKVSVILDCEEKKAYLQNGNPTLGLIGAGMVNPNLLHNWYFANPVNQRNGYIAPIGITAYSDEACTASVGTKTIVNPVAGFTGNAAYYLIDNNTVKRYVKKEDVVSGYVDGLFTIDRWGRNGGTVQVDGGLSWEQAYVLYQPFEYPLNDGNRRTFSYLDSAGNLASGELTTEYSLIGEVMACHANTNNLYLLSTRSDLKIVAVKLELGDTQTLAHQENGNWVLNEIPDYSEELLKCCMSTADPADDYANNKKTPAAINAVSKSGDTMTGNLTIDVGGTSKTQLINYNNRTFLRNIADGNNYRDIVFGEDSARISGKKAGVDFYHDILHTGNMESLGCGKIATGSYVGTGCCGPDYANVLTFGFKPALVVIVGWDTAKNSGGSITLVRGAQMGGETGIGAASGCEVTWDGNSVSWYFGSTNYDADDSFGYPWRQYNASNTTYHWFAIG